jgi:branched-subunit amino acid transport protein
MIRPAERAAPVAAGVFRVTCSCSWTAIDRRRQQTGSARSIASVRQHPPRWAASVAVIGALTALVAWSCWQRWQLLAASPFPLGVDGYFYPVQLRALLDHGSLQYPSSPLAFYLLAPFAALTDPITGTKLGAALIGAAVAWPAYGLGARLGGGRGAGLVAAALATTSVGSTYLTIEFVKNSIGLTVALTALWLVLRALERPTKLTAAVALAAVAAAFATHKMAAGLVLVAIPATLAAATRRAPRRFITALVLTAAVLLVIGALSPQRFLSAGDAPLLLDLLSSTPRWTAPALVLPTGELALGHDAWLGFLLALVAITLRLARARSLTRAPADLAGATAGSADLAAARSAAVVRWSILVLALAIGLPFLAVTDREGLGFRLRIVAFVPAALTAAIVTRDLFGRHAHRDYGLAALAALLVVVRQPSSALEGQVITHPALVTAAQALNGQLPPDATLIIPERHVAFLVAWYAGARIALRPDAIPAGHRYRLLPLHFIGADTALDHLLLAARAEPSLRPPLGLHPRHPNGLVLVAEPTWDWILAHLPATDRAHFSAWPTI